MAPEVHTPRTPSRIWLGRAGVLSGGILLPPVLVGLSWWVAGEGYGSLATIRSVAVIGPVVAFFHRVFVSLYFPPFLVTGSVAPAFALLGLYLLFAVVYLARRRWVCAGVLLVVPIVCTWIFSAALLGD